MTNRENFHSGSFGVFLEIPKPAEVPQFTAIETDSNMESAKAHYWYDENGVYRESSKWYNIRENCYFHLDGMPVHEDPDAKLEVRCGFCAWGNFSLIQRVPVETLFYLAKPFTVLLFDVVFNSRVIATTDEAGDRVYVLETNPGMVPRSHLRIVLGDVPDRYLVK